MQDLAAFGEDAGVIENVRSDLLQEAVARTSLFHGDDLEALFGEVIGVEILALIPPAIIARSLGQGDVVDRAVVVAHERVTVPDTMNDRTADERRHRQTVAPGDHLA